MNKKILSILLFLPCLLFSQNQKVLLGIDVLEKENFSLLNNKRVGLITNHTGVNSKLILTVDLLNKTPKVKLISVFSPEHGFHGLGRAGESIDDFTDAKTGVKFYSLYGKRTKPTKEMLEDRKSVV